MKTSLLRLLALLACFAAAVHAADDKILAAVRAADDERTSATKAGDRARLNAIFSDALHYAHSNGKIDTKASLIDAITSKRTVYESFEWVDRNFVVAGPGVVLMNGRILIKAVSNGARADNDLNILAVWREEGGKWRFMAWQSCKNPPADPAKK